MAITLGCKRLLAPYADLLEPLQKRGRLDAHMAGPEDCYAAPAGCYAPSGLDLRRRRSGQDEFQDLASERPAEKRLRFGEHILGGSPGAASGSEAETGSESREVALDRWAEEMVKALHGCPSVEEAVQRCAQVLAAFESQAKEAALREVDAGEDSVQSLQYTKKVLMRAVNHLAQRCRQTEAAVAENDKLRDELESAKEALRRMAHHNEMLKCHLKLHVDSCR